MRCTNLLVAEDFLDVAQCLSALDHKAMLDRQSHRASNPLARANMGETQQIISFCDDPKYAVLLWQQGKLHGRTNAEEDI